MEGTAEAVGENESNKEESGVWGSSAIEFL